MATENVARLRALVEQAVEMDPDTRNSWLESACDGNAALRDRVLRLLRDALLDDGFLDPLPAPSSLSGLPAGTEVGPYRLTRVLGAGGMGTVYEAEQSEPRRRVALKVMQAAALPPSARHRFRHEVEILASLRHPGVAQVYEAGVMLADGREVPWFAMEFVEDARSILEHARGAGLGRDETLALFARVCDAVHHGHARGIVHRDLKPDNILVDAEGRPKLIDFGVARAEDHGATALTGIGEVVGTLSYMSPEQILGDRHAVDTRTDVYSLGVVLFELLTGELPYVFEPRDLVTVTRTIRETPPRRPSTLRADLRGDPDTILLKCLEKNPERRYASADALAEDLRRYLAREPIAAHPPSVAYQLRMFARRNRVLVFASALVLVAAVGAAAVSIAFAVEAGRSETLALERGDEARRQRDHARSLFNTLLARSVEASERDVPRVQKLRGGGPVARRMTEEALEDLEALLAIAGDDPYVKLKVLGAHLALGALEGDAITVAEEGDRAAALRSYRRAEALAREILAADPSDIHAEHGYGLSLIRQGRVERHEDRDAAREKIVAGAAVLEGLHRRWRDGSIEPSEYLQRNILLGLASAHQEQLFVAADLAAVRRHAESQLELNEEIARRWDDDEARFGVARSLAAVAGAMAAAGDHEGGARRFEAARAMLRTLIEEDPDNTVYRLNLGTLEWKLARCLGALGRIAEADRLANHARDVLKDLHEDDPDNLTFARDLGKCWFWVARSAEAMAAAEPADRLAHLERAAEAYGAAARLWGDSAEASPEYGPAAANAERHRERVRSQMKK